MEAACFLLAPRGRCVAIEAIDSEGEWRMDETIGLSSEGSLPKRKRVRGEAVWTSNCSDLRRTVLNLTALSPCPSSAQTFDTLPMDLKSLASAPWMAAILESCCVAFCRSSDDTVVKVIVL
jgi:hypothetical protein